MDSPHHIAFARSCLATAPLGAAAFLEAVDEAVTTVVAPAAAAVDRDAAHPAASLEALAAVGATGVQVPREHGGLGYGNGMATLVVERVARACASTAAILMFHYQVVNRTLAAAAPGRRDADLAAFAGGVLGASAWTEPNTTGDKTDLTTSLRADGDHLTVDGLKTFCTGLRSAAVIDVLLAADLDGERGPTFVRVDTKQAGVEIADIYPMLGLRGSGTGSVRLRAVPAERADLVGEVGSARALMAANHQVALNPGVLALGIASAALAAAERVCREDLAAGPGAPRASALRSGLAEAALQVEAAYAYAGQLVAEMNRAPDRAIATNSRLKVHATVAARGLTQQLLLAAGSRGFLGTWPFERHLRDAQATALMGPTNELCLGRVADDLLPAATNAPGGAA
jgi:alkylation response protein AidB-like acyl-CoA dehydrogenase